jgi:Tfp pilus assembly protein PilV
MSSRVERVLTRPFGRHTGAVERKAGTGAGGFTLVEALVASAILAAGMIAVLQGYGVAVMALDTSREVMAVTEKLEETLAGWELSAWPRRQPPARDGGTWATPAGAMEWQGRGDEVMATTNSTLYRVTLESAPDGGAVRYGMVTEWLDVRGRP